MNKAAAVPQLTFRAVLLAIILAMILAAANAYLGLFAGLTIATAIPAAVVSMGVLRLLGGGTILEKHALEGFQGETGVMPAKGGRTDLPDDIVRQAVEYMVAQSR